MKKTFFLPLLIIVFLSLFFLPTDNVNKNSSITVFKTNSLSIDSYDMYLNGILARNISNFLPGDIVTIKVNNVKNNTQDEIYIRELITVTSDSNIELDMIKIYDGELKTTSDIEKNIPLKIVDGVYTNDEAKKLNMENSYTFIYTIYFDKKVSSEYFGRRIYFQFVIESIHSLTSGEWNTEFILN